MCISCCSGHCIVYCMFNHVLVSSVCVFNRIQLVKESERGKRAVTHPLTTRTGITKRLTLVRRRDIHIHVHVYNCTCYMYMCLPASCQ